MSCETYQEKMSEALASGESTLGGELAAHLRTCQDCREFYEGQQRLLGAIDMGIRAMANEAAPASLLPGVRTRMETATPSWGWTFWLMPAAGVVTAALFIAVPLVRHSSRSNKVQVAVSAQNPDTAPTTKAHAPIVSERLVTRRDPAWPITRPIRQSANAAILVDPKEAQGLEVLAEAARNRPQWAVAMAHPVQMQLNEPRPIHPLEFVNLEVKSLSDK